ncbi:MAG: fumarylacetoacetate hydrolase family protein [Streptosporangiaceae bacterium]
MRIARFSHEGDVAFGVVEGDPPAIARLAGHPFGEFRFTGERFPVSDVRLLPPVLPTKVVAIGKNYADHAREMGGDVPDEPVIFLKPSSSVIGPGGAITYPRQSRRVDHEAELAVVVGRLCRDVPRERAAEVVFGYACGNDVTARDLQKADGQWTRAKSFDTFCPLGPWIETDVDPADLAIGATVSGEPRQNARTSQLLDDVPSLVTYVSSVMTLIPGDVILTGTPAGIGPMEVGDEVAVTIEGIGTLTNRVVSRD